MTIDAKAINHIGIAVRSIDAHRAFYERTLGARFEGIEEIPSYKLRIGLFAVGPADHEVRLELLEPISPDSTVAAFIDRHGEGLHHVAYTVDRLDERLAALEAAGIQLIDEKPRPGARHTRVGFLHPKSTCGVLTELCEPASEPAESRQDRSARR